EDRARTAFAEIARTRRPRCVIVGNGPSLNLSNLDLLADVDVFISNFAIISKKLQQHATYLTIVNDLVAQQGAVDFNALRIRKILPFWMANCLTDTDETLFVPATVIPEFATEVGQVFSWRSTVSFFNMQLAYAMGYEEVALIGFDHSFQQAETAKEGDAIKQTEDDPNHFDPRYFRGKTWQAADTGNMEKMYRVAEAAYAKAGRKIVNATVGGKLEVFPRETLEAFVGAPAAAPTAAPATPRAAQAASPASAAAPVAAQPLRTDAPRLLVFDKSQTASGSATGELKASLFADWPAERFLQVGDIAPARQTLTERRASGGFATREASAEEIAAATQRFRPDVVLYRPVPDTPVLHGLAMRHLRGADVPLVTWLMDDWPDLLSVE
ncbi:MAG: hypothetical protein AAFR44_12890, partial [Pseudomonadota bacterium]